MEFCLWGCSCEEPPVLHLGGGGPRAWMVSDGFTPWFWAIPCSVQTPACAVKYLLSLGSRLCPAAHTCHCPISTVTQSRGLQQRGEGARALAACARKPSESSGSLEILSQGRLLPRTHSLPRPSSGGLGAVGEAHTQGHQAWLLQGGPVTVAGLSSRACMDPRGHTQ